MNLVVALQLFLRGKVVGAAVVAALALVALLALRVALSSTDADSRREAGLVGLAVAIFACVYVYYRWIK